LSNEEKLFSLNPVFLDLLAESKGLKKRDLMSDLYKKMSKKEINEYYEECIDGGNVTLFFFKTKTKPDNYRQHINEVLAKLNAPSNRKKVKAEMVSNKPKILQIKTTERYLKLFFYWKEKEVGFISIQEDGYIGYCQYPRYSKAIVKIHFNFDEIEFRIRDNSMTNEIKRQIESLFSVKLEKVTFEGKLEKLIDFAKGVSHTDVRPQSEIISTVGFTATTKAKETKKLLEDKQYQEFYRGGRLVGINLNTYINDPYNLGSQRKLVFRVNVKGKIYFFNNVREKEIEYVIQEISRIVQSS